MASSARSTTIFRSKTGTGGADHWSAPPVPEAADSASSRLFAVLHLQSNQIISRLLRMRRRAEDRPLVVLQDLQPPCDISRVILADFRGQVEIGAEEGAAQFGH